MKLDWISYLNPCEKDNVNLLMKILYCIKSILERGKVSIESLLKFCTMDYIFILIKNKL